MEASVNAVNIEEGTQRIGRCRLTSIYLEDLRTGYTRNANASRRQDIHIFSERCLSIR